jgi:hypothetical protein
MEKRMIRNAVRRGLPRVIVALALLLLAPALSSGQTIPPVTGRTFTLPTSDNHKLFIPDTLDLTNDAVDVLVHFHGDPATVNNNAGYAGLNAVIVNVTYSGTSGAYSTPFSNTALFGNLMDGALATLRAQPDIADTVDWDQLSLSSFSAGYGAVREILKQPTYFNQIDGLLMADSIYASYTSGTDHTPLDSQMVNFRAFAQAAAAGTKTMIVSHSQVLTYSYSNTAETADDLMDYLGISPTAINQPGLGTLQFYRTASQGNFQVWGATGSDAAAHSRHLQYMAEWLDELPFDSAPPPPGGNIVTLADFEAGEGTFNYSPLYSGSNVGIQAATADRVTDQAHTGVGAQRISVTKNPADPSWLLRHTSGGGFPANNVPVSAEGYIGFWLLTTTPGVSVQIGLDDFDGLSADLSTLTPVTADGQWHLYQWDLDDPDQWDAWATGDGTVTGPTFTIDAIFFQGASDAVIYLDDVAYNNHGNLAPPVEGDLDGDGFVGIADLNIILSNWNQAVPIGDKSAGDIAGIGDGFIGIDDLNLLLTHWNAGIPPAHDMTIPEPAGLTIMLTALTATLRRRNRSTKQTTEPLAA